LLQTRQISLFGRSNMRREHITRETCPVWPAQPIIAHWGAPSHFVSTPTDRVIDKKLDPET
jgi:hypothetical protein